MNVRLEIWLKYLFFYYTPVFFRTAVQSRLEEKDLAEVKLKDCYFLKFFYVKLFL
jgi:hypothetical protein